MWRHVQSGSLSSAPRLDVAIPANCDVLEIALINWRPVTDNTIPWLRFSQSGAVLAGASDYEWCFQAFNTNTTDAADNQIRLANDSGNAAGEHSTFEIRLYRPLASALVKTAIFSGFQTNTAGAMFAFQGGGSLVPNTNPIDGVRLMFSSGDIAEGFYIVNAARFS
jgi:hypothetical protein